MTGLDAGGARLRARPAGARRRSSTRTSRCSQVDRAGYQREGKRYVTVAVGCTGGKHRSVAMAEELAARLRRVRDWLGTTCRWRHRDLGRE